MKVQCSHGFLKATKQEGQLAMCIFICSLSKYCVGTSKLVAGRGETVFVLVRDVGSTHHMVGWTGRVLGRKAAREDVPQGSELSQTSSCALAVTWCSRHTKCHHRYSPDDLSDAWEARLPLAMTPESSKWGPGASSSGSRSPHYPWEQSSCMRCRPEPTWQLLPTEQGFCCLHSTRGLVGSREVKIRTVGKVTGRVTMLDKTSVGTALWGLEKKSFEPLRATGTEHFLLEGKKNMPAQSREQLWKPSSSVGASSAVLQDMCGCHSPLL